MAKPSSRPRPKDRPSLSGFLVQIGLNSLAYLLIGATLAFLFLFTVPITSVPEGASQPSRDQQPEHPSAPLAKFLSGPLHIRWTPGTDAGMSPEGLARVGLALAGAPGSYSFTQGDLNRFFSSSVNLANLGSRAMEQIQSEGEEAGSYAIPREINFRVEDGTFQFSGLISMRVALIEEDIRVLIRGHFDNSGRFRSDAVYLNSARIPSPLEGAAIRRISSALVTSLSGAIPGSSPELRIKSGSVNGEVLTIEI